MRNIAMDREKELWGAFMVSPEVRAEVNSEDFVTEIYRKAAQEVHDLEAGKITKEELEFLPILMESNRLPSGVKYGEGLILTVKEYSRVKRLNYECLKSCWATKSSDIESVKQKVSEI